MLQELIEKQEQLQGQMAAIKARLAEIDLQIDTALSGQAAALRQASGRDTGTVNFTQDGYEIAATLPKKVKWDNNALGQLAKRMAESGDNPAMWLKVVYSVEERRYKEWPDGIKAAFEPARTVETGKPTYKFKKIEA